MFPFHGIMDTVMVLSYRGNPFTETAVASNNFSRGDQFREIYGTNLPKTYPVIDSNDNGNVSSLKSIDLTAPYYKSQSKLTKTIKSDIDELSSFRGTDKVINGKEYSVKNVKSRTLTVVIPGNSPADRKNTIKSLSEYAKEKGVNLVIKEYGNSTKYS